MVYNIKIGNATILQVLKLNVDKPMNSLSTYEIAADGLNKTIVNEATGGATVTIEKNGNVFFVGEVENRTKLPNGGLLVQGFGWEHELTEDKVPTGSSYSKVWTSSNDHTILTDILSGSGWSLNTSNSTSANIDEFRSSRSESRWNAIMRLIRKNAKDIYWNYTSRIIYLYDKKGTVDKFFLREGINISNVKEKGAKKKASMIEVWGKGDGESQAYGSAGSGKPVHTIIDRGLISDDECSELATIELTKIQQANSTITFNADNPNINVDLGDSGIVDAPNANISNAGVDVVRLNYSLAPNGNDILLIQVTNPEYRRATKNTAQSMANFEAGYNSSQTNMQGSGNQNTWGAGINAKTDYPLTVGFFISEKMLNNQAGKNIINGLNISYDIDKYKQQFGNASFASETAPVNSSSSLAGHDPVTGNSDNTEPVVYGNSDLSSATVNGTSASETPTNTAGVSVWATILGKPASENTKAYGYADENLSGAPTYYTSKIMGMFENTTGSSITIYPKFQFPSGTVYGSTTYSVGAGDVLKVSYVNTNTGNKSGFFYVYDNYSVASKCSGTLLNVYQHTHGSHEHGDGSYAAVNHQHADGSYKADNHNHGDGSYTGPYHQHAAGLYNVNGADLGEIGIGDDVSEASSVNASSVNLHLDFHNGTNWINKVDILNTGEIIESDVDISDSGTYPDVVGWWRVRVEPITTDADFAQAIVELKNFIDN